MVSKLVHDTAACTKATAAVGGASVKTSLRLNQDFAAMEALHFGNTVLCVLCAVCRVCRLRLVGLRGTRSLLAFGVSYSVHCAVEDHMTDGVKRVGHSHSPGNIQALRASPKQLQQDLFQPIACQHVDPMLAEECVEASITGVFLHQRVASSFALGAATE